MKKAFCTILALAICVLSLASCESKPTSDTLTGVITDVSKEDVLSVEVCEEYISEFGETVTVDTKNLEFSNIAVDDTITIKIETISTGKPYKITASIITKVENNNDLSQMPMDKPVIYLYPEEETVCSVKVTLDGELTCTYPEHGESGWQNFTAAPDGTLTFPDGKEYYCLYWEGVGAMTPDFSKGFCVKGSDTADFLAGILPEMGLTAREANEFIIYWLPLLKQNEYNLISFQGEAYTDVAELEITPTPDSVLRVFMSAKPLDAPVEIEPQKFASFERNGFTVVEWGGGIVG